MFLSGSFLFKLRHHLVLNGSRPLRFNIQDLIFSPLVFVMDSAELQNRVKQVAYRTVPVCDTLPQKKISRIIADQSLHFAFSVAANDRAACKGQSIKAFKSELSIAFEEIDEAQFWP